MSDVAEDWKNVPICSTQEPMNASPYSMNRMTPLARVEAYTPQSSESETSTATCTRMSSTPGTGLGGK